MNNLWVDLTISNPPYWKSNTTTRDFLSYVKTDIILIAPLGLERDVKKKYLPIRGNFDLVYREEIKEEFSQTKTKTCFYILKYKWCKK
jgi:tRNA1(Val) A37 N6-methylase TrmN6